MGYDIFMLDIRLLRDESETVKKGLAAKGADASLADEFLKWDKLWREVTAELEDLRAEQNRLSRERAVDEAKANKERVRGKEKELEEVEAKKQAAFSPRSEEHTSELQSQSKLLCPLLL